MIDYRQIERAAIIHGLAQKPGGGDGTAIVTDRDNSGLLHGANFGQSFAAAAQRYGADGPDVCAGYCGSALHDRACHRGVVIDWPRVWHRADRREAATRRRARARFDRFGAFAARLAQMAMQVDKTWRNHEARGVEDRTIWRCGRTLRKLRWGDSLDPVSINPYVELRIGPAHGIDDTPVFNVQHGRILWHHRFPFLWQS